MIKRLFPTSIYQGTVGLHKELARDIAALSREDRMGKEWSKTNYVGGYTSYGSLSDLHHRTPAFMKLNDRLQPHAEKFAKALGWQRRGLKLEMNACWMNIMPKGTYHTLHLHPHSVLSGAYYVDVPTGSVSLKLEDPRMPLFMHAPVRPLYHHITPKPGSFVLFESWLRHEVPPNLSARPRISVSFNYSLETDS